VIAPLVLLGFAVTASIVGQRLLLRAPWVQQSPRSGIWAWQALTGSVAGAILLAGMTLAIPLLPLKSDLARLFQTTPLAVSQHYDTPAGSWLAYGALAFALGLAIRCAALVGATLVLANRRRRAQLESLSLVGRDHPGGFVVVDHQAPIVYCLPGRRRRVVVTSRALELLSPQELRLVLAHEKTHIRARHDIALGASEALRRTFGPVRLFRVAHDQVSILVEMQADDAARAVDDRRAMARALVTLTAGAPQAGLAAGDVAAVARVRRLTRTGSDRIRAGHSLLIGAATLTLLSMPLALALAPAVEATIADCWMLGA
jgi:hypothetical protein